MPNTELCFETAVELAGRIRRREVSAREVMEAHLAQIERVNPQVNAIVTLLPERALEGADAADVALARGEEVGPLHGLPVAHKDLHETKGIRTTWGSPIYTDFVPTRNTLIVERLQNAGAITIGKTNTPEFGAGSQTFNEVFGATLNPYDLDKTCGGSSGGAAVALACRMLPVADGSDMGGSLRNPAGYCNVVGFRPSPGRVPSWPALMGWFPIPVQGPMARTVQDVALMLQAIAGPDSRVPISLSDSPSMFAQSLARDFSGVRIAWSSSMGGLPVDARVVQALESQRHVFAELGCQIDEATPNFEGADEAFKVWRAWIFAAQHGPNIEKHRDQIKDTVIWNAEEGLKLSGPQIAEAEKKRTQLYQRMHEFMQEYEYLILPVSQVPPFDVEQPYVTEINTSDGTVQMETYIDWMKSCYFISATGLPAASVPCGFTPEGLPVGVQIVGRHQNDFGVLQLAHAFEQATQLWQQVPAVAGSAS